MTDETSDKPGEQPPKPDMRQNPWYVLMTVEGEQAEDATAWHYNEDLHEQNRRYFNGWMVRGLSAEQKQKLIETKWAEAEDFEEGGALAPLTDKEMAKVEEAIADRCPEAEPLDRSDYAVKLAGSELARPLICQGFLFSAAASFQNATFSAAASFQNATFSAAAYFENATFSADADFENATFSADADFENATFSAAASFQNATFSAYAVFQNATFSAAAYFQNATFSADADFENATFSADAYFQNATFSADADFQNATFSARAFFHNATFSADAFFQNATFSARAFFHNATFSADAFFQNATFSARAFFHNATFSADAFFQNAEFRSSTRFVRALFLKEVPQFFDTTVHQDTDFTDAEWPPVPDDEDPKWRRQRAIRHHRAYERLKLIMDEQKRVQDELMFQRLELKCREVEEPWLHSVPSRLYGALSDYGASVGRPARLLLGVLFAGWAVIYKVEKAAQNAEVDFWHAGALSLSNVFGFLGFGRTFLRTELESLAPISQVVSSGQTILGLILFFLLGLALRNRFRIK